MRNCKTSQAKRTTYRYYDNNGKLCCELIPGQDGVTEVIIQQLHALDDDEFDADRREKYHVPVHYAAYVTADAEEASDRNTYLADVEADPSLILEKAFSRADFKSKFFERWKHLTHEQRQLVLRKAQGETNVSIAKELGVSETAIRKKLKRIQAYFSDIH